MITANVKRGFPAERFEKRIEPRVRSDEGGHFIYTLSENVKVYLEDYYSFLEKIEQKALTDLKGVKRKLAASPSQQEELRSYLHARKAILETLLKTLYDFYTEAKNFGVIMTPWCFGTVVLEKVEAYRDRLSRGDVKECDLPDYPYYTVRYIDEIHRKVLLDIFEFPEQAFAMRWQYSELLRRYSSALANISTSLQSVMLLVKSYGS